MATTQTLRDELFSTMEKLQKGCITTKEAQATAKIAANIIYATRLELENKRMELKAKRSIPANQVAKLQSIKM